MADKKNTYTAHYTHYPHTEEVVDEETGEVKIRVTEQTTTRQVEVLEDYVDIKLPKKFRFNNGNFITIFQKAMANIALFGDFSKEEYRILLYLIGTCGAQNSVCTDLDKLANELSMKKPNVSRGLKGLTQRNIVVRKDGYRYGKTPLPFELHLDFDQINYNLGYNGKIQHYKSDKVTHPEIMQSDGVTPLIENKSKQKCLPTLEEALFDEDYDVSQPMNKD